MRLPLLLPVLLLLAPASLAAQPPGGGDGPWAADADGDGRITREEMSAYMERRFSLMDNDGDGLVPAQTMQRLLGHERQRTDDAASGGQQQGAGERGRGRGDRPGGPGGGSSGPGGPGGPGGPPPGGRPGGERAQADGPPPPPPGRAMPYPEDGNDDGMIDRMEFVAPALAMFADRDLDGDGVLTAQELPPPPAPPQD